MAEHDKMNKDHQILSLGNVNYKIKRELTENKSRNIYMQREAGGHPFGAINWPKLRERRHKTGSHGNMDWRKKPELHAEEQKPMEWLR